MIKQLLTVYDQKAGVYMQPAAWNTVPQGVRELCDIAKQEEKSHLAKHPEDFQVFHIGEFNDGTAEVKMFESKKNLGTIQELLGPKLEQKLKTV